ncbi:transcriptional regulator, ArgR family [Butyrivibrio hungatei DSM 14810]|uniref:Arginine repressor n=1 Tax=Butyrivibrio hungatei DSM 14810 TaxID=1121132 RepID=A0A1M7S4G3_9FIRM|nr:arginine repressor [Butyrivibrio hungatei]SHN53293.1 transcriptional regulator, ArgR family [Butyrivibrio hungatei DSM 14810]
MKKNRHDKIIEIIARNVVETQEQLAALLKDAGYDVTQATVSRDIRQMKLTKQVTEDGKSKYVYTTADSDVMQDKYVSVLKAGFVSMDLAQNILVMKTVSGMAMALAAALDALNFPQIVGCIAGDDTIMIAIKTNEEAVEIMEEIQHLMNED